MARLLMSMTRLYSSTMSSLHLKTPYPMFRTLSSSKATLLHKNADVYWSRPSLGYRYLNYHNRMHKNIINKRNFVAYNSISGAPLPSQPPSNSLRSWILGLVLTIIFPFITNKWGPLLQLKNEVDTAVETIEHITDVVEKVAEVVEKVAEDISDELPDGGNLKKTVDFIENVAGNTAKEAHLVGDIIDKVQEVEVDVESIVESLEAKEHSKEEKDEK